MTGWGASEPDADLKLACSDDCPATQQPVLNDDDARAGRLGRSALAIHAPHAAPE
jgi:hypothetical protein